jgi:type I restriction enzyme S subunit
MQEENLLSLSYGRIIQKDIETAEGLLPESFETYQIVEPGNIVMRLTDLQNDKRSLRQGLVKERGIITSAYDALEVGKDHDSRFWAYALLALDLAKYYYSLGGGVRQSIKFDDFPNDWVATPDLKTQKAIADFLDCETARIDQLIEKKRTLKAVLAERLDSHASDIVGGLEWRSMKLSRLVRLVDGDRSSEYPSDTDLIDSGVPFFSSKQIKSRILTLQDVKFISEEKFSRLGRGKLQDGDVIITVRGTLGNSAVFTTGLTESGFINAQLMIMRPLPGYDFFTRSPEWRRQIEVEGYGSAQKQLNQDVLRRFSARYPIRTREAEWKAYISRLLEHHERIDHAMNSSIAKLNEFRSALITAAVTGQIDLATWNKRGTTDPRLDQIEEAMRA